MNTMDDAPVGPFIDFWGLLLILGWIQGLFLAVNCFSFTAKRRLSHDLLGWLLVSVCLTEGEVFLCYSRYIVYAPFLVEFSEPLNFVIPPLLYYYTQSLLNPTFQWRRQYTWFFLPAFLHAIYLIPFFAQSNAWLLATVRLAYHQSGPTAVTFRNYWWASSYKDFFRVFKYILIGYQISYVLVTLRSIIRVRRFDGLSRAALQWVEQLSWSFLLLAVAYTVVTAYYQSDVGDIYVASGVSLVCFRMSARFVAQSKILDYHPPINSATHIPPVKYKKTALGDEAFQQTLSRLLTAMETEKRYRQPDLSLPELAAQLAFPAHYLSQVINQQFNQHFVDFINTYRVREIQEKLLMTQFDHFKIEELAFAAGFNSKSAFNVAFKKMIHQTPSQFRKANRMP